MSKKKQILNKINYFVYKYFGNNCIARLNSWSDNKKRFYRIEIIDNEKIIACIPREGYLSLRDLKLITEGMIYFENLFLS